MGSGTFELLDKALRRMKDEGVTEESAVSKYYDEIFTYYDICDAVLERLALSRRAAPGDRESVKRWLKDYSMSYDMIMLAADRARDASGQKMAYFTRGTSAICSRPTMCAAPTISAAYRPYPQARRRANRAPLPQPVMLSTHMHRAS